MPTRHSFQVEGMSCQHCVRAVTQAVQDADPTAQVTVDLATGRVDVQSDRDRDALARVIANEGYTVAAA
jgi:copper chaperone